MDEMPLRAGKKKSTNLMQQQASNSSKPSTRFESTIRMKELPNLVTLTSESDDEEQDDEGKLIMRKVSTQRQLQSKEPSRGKVASAVDSILPNSTQQ
ncbi:unnamed protein product [Clavelina lepadiformis]|uniref:Uncharacterized protein n=1 Tax=Clavelina lepadiformis TaxID=159417 RepID=A0ABP0FMX5_CLALP